MKIFILLIATTALLNNAMAQTTSDILKQQAGEGVKEGATLATEHAADKATDKLLNSIFTKKNKKPKKDNSMQAPTATAESGFCKVVILSNSAVHSKNNFITLIINQLPTINKN